MKAPIIIEDHGDVFAFTTIAKAERYIEAIDVKNDEYNIYDSEGRKLEGTYDDLWGPVKLKESKTSSHRIELEKVLREFFMGTSEDTDWVNLATLEELVSKIVSNIQGVN